MPLLGAATAVIISFVMFVTFLPARRPETGREYRVRRPLIGCLCSSILPAILSCLLVEHFHFSVVSEVLHDAKHLKIPMSSKRYTLPTTDSRDHGLGETTLFLRYRCHLLRSTGSAPRRSTGNHNNIINTPKGLDRAIPFTCLCTFPLVREAVCIVKDINLTSQSVLGRNTHKLPLDPYLG